MWIYLFILQYKGHLTIMVKNSVQSRLSVLPVDSQDKQVFVKAVLPLVGQKTWLIMVGLGRF